MTAMDHIRQSLNRAAECQRRHDEAKAAQKEPKP